MMARKKPDIPLGSDSGARLLPWIVAVILYVAGLAIAGASVMSDFAARWETGLSGALTIQIPPATDIGGQGAARITIIERATEAIRTTKGVKEAVPLADEEMRLLLAPWLGTGTDPRDLPLPTLIAVTLAPDVTLTALQLRDLERRLVAIDPTIQIDDHGQWQARLVTFLETLRMVAGLLITIVAIAGVTIVVFATHSGMLAHRDSIELLHLIGARDRYIAGQFQTQAFFAGLKGGILGVVATTLTVFLLGHGAEGTGAILAGFSGLTPGAWGILTGLPVLSGLIALVAARLTVLRALARMI